MYCQKVQLSYLQYSSLRMKSNAMKRNEMDEKQTTYNSINFIIYDYKNKIFMFHFKINIIISDISPPILILFWYVSKLSILVIFCFYNIKNETWKLSKQHRFFKDQFIKNDHQNFIIISHHHLNLKWSYFNMFLG